jgi:hypothetical protein
MSENINFEANLVAIAAVLAAHGIHQVASYYNGSGDSGDEYSQTAYDADQSQMDLPDVEVLVEQRQYQSGAAGHHYVVQPVSVSLSSAISDATEHAISEAGHSGWENNEGGKGTLSIFASGYAVLNHTNYYEGDSDHDYVEHGPDTEFGETLAEMAAVLRKHGLTSVQGEYTGSGDSGDGFDIYYFKGDESVEVDEDVDDEVTYLVVETEYKDGQFVPVKSARSAEFEQALEDVCFAMVSASGHDGWEINEGGGGKFTVRDDGTATLDHYDNGEDNGTDSSTSWNDNLQQEDDEPVGEDM